MLCNNFWGISGTFPEDVSSFFLTWQFFLLVPHSDLSRMTFFVTIWSLWLHRNDLVLKNKEVDALQLVDVIRLRLALWCKGKWPFVTASFNVFFIDLSSISVKNYNSSSWKNSY